MPIIGATGYTTAVELISIIGTTIVSTRTLSDGNIITATLTSTYETTATVVTTITVTPDGSFNPAATSPSPNQKSIDQGSSFSTDAKIGLRVGLPLGVFLFMAIAYFMGMRHGSRSKGSQAQRGGATESGGAEINAREGDNGEVDKSEIGGMSIHELRAENQPQELATEANDVEALGQNPIHELDGTPRVSFQAAREE
ncbi:hypothetical protein BS50DRAFT_633294 [Corynespora cassiicola Philippines]|uniref:Mid2 domain-containing protein n=1 Tax=Corynespora cassiicola Philippines TaxID=1448308 RepID=A0A2T2NQ89_CORCC|nr:hypothetical protein BS50DRAFT_633294 [Corynespora cassiicola Philippines]